jgi:hypothetical protein
MATAMSAVMFAHVTTGNLRSESPARPASLSEKQPGKSASATLPALLRGVFVRQIGEKAQVRIELRGEAEISHFTLADPKRIVIDLAETRTVAGQTIHPVKSLIKAIRIGRPSRTVVRVVIEVRDDVTYLLSREDHSIVAIISPAGNHPPVANNLLSEQPLKTTPEMNWKLNAPLSDASISTRRRKVKAENSPDETRDSRKSDTRHLTKAESAAAKTDTSSALQPVPALTEPTMIQKGSTRQPKPVPLPIEEAAKNARIMVNDRLLTGPFNSPQQRGHRTFLPIVSIAYSLGDQIVVNASTRSVEVRRQTGVVAEFNSSLNQVRENGAVILGVNGTGDIVFPFNAEELMLPVEIVSALLDVSVITDEVEGAIRISRGQFQADLVQDGPAHSLWQIRQAEYGYNLYRSADSYSQNIRLLTSGRLADGVFNFTAALDGSSGQRPMIFRRGTFTFERPNGERYIGGDFGTGTDLQFMSAAMRGIWTQRNAGKARLTAFAGKAISDPLPALISSSQNTVAGFSPAFFQASRARYDTTVLGSYLSFGPSLKQDRQDRQLLFSTGAMLFRGPAGNGEILTGGMKYGTRRMQFQSDLGFGRFSGIRQSSQISNSSVAQLPITRVKGTALLADLSGSFNVVDSLTFQVRYLHVGDNALSPQSGNFALPVRMFVVGASWRPRQWLSASFTSATQSRVIPSPSRDRSLTGTLSITPRHFWPTFLISHTQTRNSLAGNSGFTFVNATKDFNRFRLFANYTRIQFGSALQSGIPTGDASNPLLFTPFLPTSGTLAVGGSVRLNEFNSLQGVQSIGRDVRNTTIDWQNSKLLTQRLSLGAGIEYDRSGARQFFGYRMLAAVQLPREQTLQFAFVQSKLGPQILIELRGPFLARRRNDIIGTPITEIDSFGAIHGRVYHDVNFNGRYDTGTDQPLAGVRLRLDSGLLVETDDSGNFKLVDVQAGDHLLAMDLLSVRADLTILDNSERAIMLRRGRDAVVDFRLIRSGRITGVVWHDLNENGKQDGDEPGLADVRVLTGSGRDTLTNQEGTFLLGDLPPGNHVLIVDQRSLPEGLLNTSRPISISVKAGEETRGADFPIITRPPEVKIKQFPPADPK